jgi:replicative DNA helicase
MSNAPNRSLGFNIEVPSDVMSEQSLIASVLLGGNRILRSLTAIDKSMFYRVAHSLIWESYNAIEKAGQVIDIVTVNEELTKRNALEACGGLAYIMQCAELLPSTQNFESYAKLVTDYHRRREIIFASEHASKRASTGDDDIEVIIKDLNNSVTFVNSGNQTDDLSKLIWDTTNEAILRDEDKLDFSIGSGYTEVDSITGGWRNGELIILGGRPSMGKSSLGLQYAWNAAKFMRSLDQKTGVLIVSAEMSKDMVTARMLSIYSEVDSQVIQTKKLNNFQKDKLHLVAQEAKTLHVRIVADKTVTLGGIRDSIRDTQKSFHVGLVVVDYLQMIAMPSSYKSENRTRDIGVISRGLKDIAREFACPVIALSSLSRAVEQRQDKRPMMSDLRESGDIESDADVIQFIYRAGYYERKQDGGEGDQGIDKAEVITAKNRNGRTGVSLLEFNPNYAKFSDYGSDFFDL